MLLYMVTFTINIPPMLAYIIPYMDPMGYNMLYHFMGEPWWNHDPIAGTARVGLSFSNGEPVYGNAKEPVAHGQDFMDFYGLWCLWMFMDVQRCLWMLMMFLVMLCYAYSYHNYRKHIKRLEYYRLVGGLEHFLFFHILGIMIPTD